MADVRIPAGLPTVATPTPARSTEAVRAAQRAFFNTALSDAGAAAPSRPTAAGTATQPKTAAAAPLRRVVGGGEEQAAPARMLRPGSLLDIRI